jgi:hypothetical protein
MDPVVFEELYKKIFIALEFEEASFDEIVNQYTCVLDSLFGDNVINRKRFYIGDYLAVYNVHC